MLNWQMILGAFVYALLTFFVVPALCSSYASPLELVQKLRSELRKLNREKLRHALKELWEDPAEK